MISFKGAHFPKDIILYAVFSEQRDEMAATTFFKQAINGNGFPHKIVMDKSGANYAGIENINRCATS